MLVRHVAKVSSRPLALVGAALLMWTSACGSSSKTPPKRGPCERDELSSCGDPCDATTPCGAGLHCGTDGACTAECTASTAATDCGASASCSTDGRCMGGGDGDGDGDGSGDGDGDVCGSVEIGTNPIIPNVILIVDQSDSMKEKFGNTTRWLALKEALLGEDGLIAELQHTVSFGLALYSASNSPHAFPDLQGVCPVITQVEARIENYDAIYDVYYPANMIEDTPTGDAIDAVLETIDILDANGTTIFVLATDGEPDTCEALDPQTGQEEAVAAVERAYERGIRTYVVAVAEDHELSTEHAQDLANAGLGLKNPSPGQEAPFFRVREVDALKDALMRIVGGVLSCEAELEGRLTTNDPCTDGTVTLNNQELACVRESCEGADCPPGWRVVEGTDNRIEVVGSACDDLLDGGVLKARFACESVAIF